MNVALFATIWIALCLFVAGEAGKPHLLNSRVASVWAWRLWILGAAACALHIVIALGLRHGWNHESAVRETARQTAAVFGVPFGGGVYVNYLFLATWIADTWWWRTSPDRYARRPIGLVWLLRGFYFIIIINAAVVFASPIGRLIGIPLVAALLWMWSTRVGSGLQA